MKTYIASSDYSGRATYEVEAESKSDMKTVIARLAVDEDRLLDMGTRKLWLVSKRSLAGSHSRG